jgi:hypothetical protein
LLRNEGPAHTPDLSTSAFGASIVVPELQGSNCRETQTAQRLRLRLRLRSYYTARTSGGARGCHQHSWA